MEWSPFDDLIVTIVEMAETYEDADLCHKILEDYDNGETNADEAVAALHKILVRIVTIH